MVSPMAELKSYTSQATGPLQFFAEVLSLFKRYSTRELPERVAAVVADARCVEARVSGCSNKEMRDLDLMEHELVSGECSVLRVDAVAADPHLGWTIGHEYAFAM